MVEEKDLAEGAGHGLGMGKVWLRRGNKLGRGLAGEEVLRKRAFLGRRPAWENELQFGEAVGSGVKRAWLGGGIQMGKSCQLGACVWVKGSWQGKVTCLGGLHW